MYDSPMGERKRKATGKFPKIELEPDAWPRFERFIKAAAKTGPKHRLTKKPKLAQTRRRG